MPGGRPSKYKAIYAEQAEKLCRLGATDVQLAEFFHVSEVTLNAWKKKYPEFLQSLKDGKEIADSVVVKSLFQRAKGYEHPEDKIFNNNGEPLVVPTIKHYPPDTTAAIFWLKNRDPVRWRDTQHIEEKSERTNKKEIIFKPASLDDNEESTT
jgi:hypothetical protein